MTDFLPLFPLQLVVFPYEELNLHVFEPRYKQLIRECDQNGITFGIPAYIDNQLMDFGTEIELVKIEKRYENGELDIRTRGVGIFKIHDYYSVAHNKMYAGADIHRIQIDEKSNHLLNEEIFKKVQMLFDILNIKKKLPKNQSNFLTFELGHHVGFSIEQEYEFLTIPTEQQRQEYMSEHLTKLIPVVREMERLRKRAQMNGHFKNVIPPN